jgi:hypothetical protein
MKFFSLLLGLHCTAGSIHGIDFKDTEVFESLYALPHGWQGIGTPEPSARVMFKIALKSVWYCLSTFFRNEWSHLIVLYV